MGKNHIQLSETDSTNNYARELLRDSRPPEGTLITAVKQTAGRGQAGTTWQAEAGKNLTLSFIFYPEFLDASQQFFLNMAVSLAVKDFCESVTGEECKIKWPNDIYCGDKKLGGILIENTIHGSSLSSSIVGIGLNVNQQEFDPALPNPASFYQLTGKEFPLQLCTEQLCGFMEKYYLQLRQRHFNFLDKGYTVALYRYQQTHEFKKGDTTIRGEINGVTKEGKLILHCNGKEHRYGFKEVEYIVP